MFITILVSKAKFVMTLKNDKAVLKRDNEALKGDEKV